MRQSWNKWKAAGINGFRRRGFFGAIRHAVGFFKNFSVYWWKRSSVWNPWNPWYCYLDRRFDHRFAVDTAGVLILPEVHADERFRGYSPTPHSFFRKLMRQLAVDHSQFTFIDFGCGKGKVLLLASRLPFRRIIGIELSSKLISVARSNLQTYRGTRLCKTIELVEEDAREFDFPDEPTICYFWEPFEAELMKDVLENLRKSLVMSPREVFLVYLVTVNRRPLDEARFLRLKTKSSWYCIYTAEAESSVELDPS